MTTLPMTHRLPAGNRRMRGFTLLEWVIAMPLGLLIVMAATAIYLAGLRLWRVQAERYEVNERAAFALTQLTRAVGMAGYRNWDPLEGPILKADQSVRPGLGDWPSLRASAECASTVDTCPKRGWQGSTMLEVQYHGAGYGDENGNGSGAVQNCGGANVIARSNGDDRNVSAFYVDKSEDGVPSLFCRYGDRGYKITTLRPAQVLVIGVEAMYIRLGVRAGGTGPMRWMNPVKSARRKPPSAPAGSGGWENVSAVAFSLVLRGTPRRGGKQRVGRTVEVFDAASGGREYKWLTNAGDVHLHVFTVVAYRRNDGGIREEAKWLVSSS